MNGYYSRKYVIFIRSVRAFSSVSGCKTHTDRTQIFYLTCQIKQWVQICQFVIEISFLARRGAGGGGGAAGSVSPNTSYINQSLYSSAALWLLII